MPDLLPHRFLFRYSFPVRYEGKLPRRGAELLGLEERHRLPDLGRLDDATPFAELRAAWNERGLGIGAVVRGKLRLPECDLRAPEQSDGLRIWIDTRDARNIHRASRFCHHFCLLPRGGGPRRSDPAAISIPIIRAKEASPPVDPTDVALSAQVTRTGYTLECWFPAATLHGYDPGAQSRLGFYYSVRDSDLGEQTPVVGQEFPFAYDPSLWASLELAR